MDLIAKIVETQALLETSLAALVAGVGIAFTFSLTILGASRSVEASREGRGLAAAAFGAVGLMGLVVTLAAIAAGIVVMATG